MRADLYLVKNEYFESRAKAADALRRGEVLINGKAVKASQEIKDGSAIEILKADRFVSKGGIKLFNLLSAFNIDVRDMVCADLGASTGGFTDCLLQCGAKYVYAVDVGENQLSQKLKENERVKVLDKTNVRFLTKDSFEKKTDVLTVDLSFISCKLLFCVFKDLLDSGGYLLLLIKPQFEAGKGKTGKGVITKKEIREVILKDIIGFAAQSGFKYQCHTEYGEDGKNIEYMTCFIKVKAE